MIGPPEGALVKGSKQSAVDHNLAYELLSAAQIRQRFPAFQPTDNMVAVWEPRAGVLFPELAIQTHLELAAKNGAILRFDQPIERWEPHGTDVRVFTGNASYQARQLILSAGAWIGSLIPEMHLPLEIERQVLCWFEPASHAELFAPDRLPIFIMEYAASRFFYGFPDVGDGVKAALHHQGKPIQPDNQRREASDEEARAVRQVLERFLPRAPGRLLSAVVCMYTNAPDSHFIFGRHPRCSQVLIVSPCSGHGFKFSAVIGELAATVLANKVPPYDLSLFSPERLTAQSAQIP